MRLSGRGTLAYMIPLLLCPCLWGLSQVIVAHLNYVLGPGRYVAVTLTPGEILVGRFVDPSMNSRTRGFLFGWGSAWKYRDRLNAARMWIDDKSGHSWWPSYVKSQFVTSRGPRGFHFLTVPLWLPALLSCTGAVLLLIKLRRDHLRAPAVCCTQCGYDLTGNLSGACPECGRRVIVKAKPDQKADG
jgi:predicted RNA-binding Zn-ribbon protein involved in translation (DUF1610 family)